MRRPLALVTLTLAIGAVIGVALWRQHRTVDVVPQSPPIDAAEWQPYLDRVRALTPPPEAAVAPLLDAFAALNRAEVATDDPPNDRAYALAARTWLAEAERFAVRRGTDTYLDIGRRQGMRLAERLAALMDWCDKNDVSPHDAVRRPDPPPVVADYIAVGGGFVRFAEEGGLIRDGRLVEDRLPYVQALFVEHWLAPLRGRIPVDEYRWPAERAWLLRWRVEHQTTGDLDERLAAARELAALPGYPADLNAGVLLYRAGRYAEAAERFARSTHPRAIAYRRMAERAGD